MRPDRNPDNLAMKRPIATIGAAGIILFWPAWVLAADGEPATGSWLALIFYAINFLLFIWVVKKYGWSYVTQFFHDRSQTLRELRDRAEKAYQEAQELADRAARQLGQLEADQRKMASELERETAYQLAQVSSAAGEAANRIRRDTELTTVALREGAQRRLRETMAAAAGVIARELLRRYFEPSDQARLLRSFIDRIGEETRP